MFMWDRQASVTQTGRHAGLRGDLQSHPVPSDTGGPSQQGGRGGKRPCDLQGHTPILPPVYIPKHHPASWWRLLLISHGFFFFLPNAIVRFVFSSRLCDHLWRWQTRLCLASSSLCSDSWLSHFLLSLAVKDSEEVGLFYFSASSAMWLRLDRKLLLIFQLNVYLKTS